MCKRKIQKILDLLLIFVIITSILEIAIICYAQPKNPKNKIPADVPYDIKERIERLYSQDSLVRALAASELGHMCDKSAPAIQFLIGILSDNTSFKNELIMGPAFFVLDVMNGLNTPGKHAARALIKIGIPSVGPLITTLKNDKSNSTFQKNAEWVLKKITEKDFGQDTLKWNTWWNRITNGEEKLPCELKCHKNGKVKDKVTLEKCIEKQCNPCRAEKQKPKKENLIPLPQSYNPNKAIENPKEEERLVKFLKNQPQPGYLYMNVSNSEIMVEDKYGGGTINLAADDIKGNAISTLSLWDESGKNFNVPHDSFKPQYTRHIEYYIYCGFNEKTPIEKVEKNSFHLGNIFIGSNYYDFENQFYGKYYFSPEEKGYIEECTAIAIFSSSKE